MKILVINSGSSSLKYQLFDMETGEVIARGLCERIGIDGAITHKRPGHEPYRADLPLPTHDDAIALVLGLLTDPALGVIGSIDEIAAVGHRFAHGGERLRESCRITDEELRYLESIVELNPLHGPPAIAGVRACMAQMPGVPQIGAFDTAFHATIDERAYVYPVPYEWYEKYHVRRYGFHGMSHRFVSLEVARLMGRSPEEVRVIVCHLGNGSSITAVQGGRVVDTSMGFTPQEGVPMGTRSGSIDPTIIPYMQKKLGVSADEVGDLLNRASGLLGVSGVSSDCRYVLEAAQKGDRRARLAIEILAYRIKKTIGSYIAAMNGVDALVFTAGIGENDPYIRSLICADMDWLGIRLDPERNKVRGAAAEIGDYGARVRTWVIPTNEEYMIALDTARLAGNN